MNLTVKSEQSIFDIAIIAYQDASRVYDLILGNPSIDNINSEITGLNLEFTKSFLTQKEVIKTTSKSKKSVIINSMQSIFDISLQYYGGAEFAYNVILENNLDNILSDATGIELNYTINNTAVPIFFNKNNILVATKPLEQTFDTGDTFYREVSDLSLRSTSSGDLRIYA